ncbi:MAG: MFS transporter [Sphingomonadaceae bacterium]
MRAGWISYGLIYLYAVISGGSVGKLIPLVGDMAKTTHVSLSEAAWLISVISAASVLLAPFSGAMTDRLGDRKIIVAGLSVMILANVLMWPMSSFAALLAGRLLEGAGFIAVSVGTIAMVVRTTEGARQPLAMAVISTSVPLGVGLFLGFGGLFAGPNWQWVFPAHALCLAVMLALSALLPAWVKPEKNSSNAGAGMGAVLRSAGPAGLSLGICIATIAMFGFGALFPTYASGTFGVSPAVAAGYGMFSYPASIIGSLIVGPVAMHHGVGKLSLAAFALLALTGSAIFFPITGLWGSAAILFCFYIAGGMVGAIGMARLPHIIPSPDATGATTSLYMIGANAGMLIGAPIVFTVFTNAQSAGMMVLACFCALAPLVLWTRTAHR